MIKTINATTARKNFGKLLDEVSYQGHAFIIERKGKPMAAMISIEEYNKLQAVRGKK